MVSLSAEVAIPLVGGMIQDKEDGGVMMLIGDVG